MKKSSWSLFWCLLSLTTFGGYFSSPPNVRHALDYGADTKICFKVVDDQMNVVTGAMINARFVLNDNKGKTLIGLTDKDGRVTLERKSVGEVVYSAKKEGFYDTRGRIWLAGKVGAAGKVEDGKWQPYGEEYIVVLKSKKEPVPMYGYSFRSLPPKQDTVVGFDLKIGDYVKPYGDGEIVDFWMNWHLEGGLIRRSFIHN